MRGKILDIRKNGRQHLPKNTKKKKSGRGNSTGFQPVRKKDLFLRGVQLRGAGHGMLFVLHHGADELHGAAEAQEAAVDAEVIAVHGSPALGGVVLIIGGPALVGLGDEGLGLLRRQVLALGHPADPVLHRSVDEDAQMVGVAGERVVRAAADDDAGTLFGDLADGVEGSQVHLLLQGIPHAGARQGEHVGVHGNGVEQTLGPLVEVLQNLLAQAAFLGGLLQNLLIVKGNAQLLGHTDADFLAAAAELSSDGDDGLHSGTSFLGASIILRFYKIVK